ncbi:MAG: dTDP-4-dehydrorhamnose 3,5-epimerase [Proteobacteria bacterium]|nr:dTDP-4-dehydrorhamnose 3,5-epimerase [Pseudomonadota bacterium]
MEIETTDIPGVLLITPKVYEDDRGFFQESYNRKAYQEAGIEENFVQDNHSKSIRGVVRGLHYQKEYPQGKLIRVVQGEILDVIVDIRKGSPTFARWTAIVVSDENKKQVWIPVGLAHGFAVLSETAETFYKTTDYYHPEDEKGILWNDPQLDIDWRTDSPILSPKDEILPLLHQAEPDLPVYSS